MQYPVGSELNIETMRMELTSFADVIFNPVAQVKFVHTVSAGYTTAAVFVLGISSWYLLKGVNIAFARRSFAIASSFGLASVLSVIVLGDESGYELGDVQRVKLAAVEAEWETHEAPAPFTVFGLPNEDTQTTDFALRIPWAMGIIATRSLDEEVTGLKDHKIAHRERIVDGLIAYKLLDEMRRGDATPEEAALFADHVDDLGYARLLEPFTDDMENPSEEAIANAVEYSIPPVAPLFWSFRIMVGAGFLMLGVFAYAFWVSAKHRFSKPRWFLRLAVFMLPVPWIASEAGWFVAEYGRQPWAIAEVLPVHTAVSNLAISDIVISLLAVTLFYTLMFIVGMYLMLRFARKGPYPEAPPAKAPADDVGASAALEV
jgi:cytochrome d ubiquinol oxidase subunit I